jgi:hypothetical protein
MTVKQFVAMIGEAETGGAKTEADRLRAIGDNGLAGGFFQQHWAWRVDYWPAWAWALLRVLDAIALENFCARHPNMPARRLADLYNLGHEARDPQYDTRCQSGLADLGQPQSDFETLVKD